MTRPWRIVPILAALAGLGLGCGSTINTIKTKAPDPGTKEGAWAEVRNAATRRALLYDQFVHRATITVTYLSPAVREARTSRLGEWQGWTEQELADHLKEEAAEAARYDDFLVALYTAERHANDLDAHESIWRLALRLDTGDEVVTRDAKALDPNATLLNLFPYVSPFDTLYRVRFNRVPGAPLAERRFTMLVASALGKVELNFGDGMIGPDRPQGTPIP